MGVPSQSAEPSLGHRHPGPQVKGHLLWVPPPRPLPGHLAQALGCPGLPPCLVLALPSSLALTLLTVTSRPSGTQEPRCQLSRVQTVSSNFCFPRIPLPSLPWHLHVPKALPPQQPTP